MMNKQKSTIWIVGLCVITCIICVLRSPVSVSGSDSSATQQLLKLNEINNRIQDIQHYVKSQESGNMAFMGQGLEQAEIFVWDNGTQTWYNQKLGGNGQKIFESNGNICAYAQVGNKIHLAAWSKITKKWSPLIRHADMIDIVPCDGNFGFFTSNQDAGVWVPYKDGWDSKRIPGDYIMSAGADHPPLYKTPEKP